MSRLEEDEGLTRKERREQARAQRKAVEEAAVADAARRRRLIWIGVGVAVAVAAVVVIAVASSGGGKGSSPPTATNQVPAEVSSLLAGIPQQGNALGSPSAPATLQYYGDLECPVCRKFTLGSLPALIRHWVRAGKLRIEYHNLETATREPETFKTQQAAALAAGKQAKMWNFLETFYHEQGAEDSGYVTEQYLHNLATQVPGLNVAKWTADRANPSYAREIESDARKASASGFTGTPAFLIGHTGGAMKTLEWGEGDLTDPKGFEEAIQAQQKA
jgi:protein-disulfide isomerase